MATRRRAAKRPGRARGARPTGGAKPGPGIQSVQRGFRLLEIIAQNGRGTTLAEVSRAARLHPSTAFHLLRTLVTLGYLAHDPETRQYRPGTRVFQLAASACTESQLAETTRAALTELTRETGETSHLAVFERGDVVVISKIEGTGPVQIVERVGYPRPAHCTAIGKVLLAALPPPDLEAVVAVAGLKAYTPNTITNPTALRRELERVVTDGHAIDDEEFAPGIRCVAAPVRNFTGRVVAAVGVSGAIWRVTPEALPRLAETVTRTAAQVSHQLGHVPGKRG